MDKLKEFIENIEQLAANARYYNDYEDYDHLLIELQSIDYWSKKAQRLIKKNINKGDK